MQLIGFTSVFLFLASLAAFLLAILYPSYEKISGALGVLFLAAAVMILAVTIMKRNKTERI